MYADQYSNSDFASDDDATLNTLVLHTDTLMVIFTGQMTNITSDRSHQLVLINVRPGRKMTGTAFNLTVIWLKQDSTTRNSLLTGPGSEKKKKKLCQENS